jgi:hypothetical protein
MRVVNELLYDYGMSASNANHLHNACAATTPATIKPFQHNDGVMRFAAFWFKAENIFEADRFIATVKLAFVFTIF